MQIFCAITFINLNSDAMHKHLSFAISFIVFITFSFTAVSQQWTDNLPQKSGEYTFFDYQNAFNEYWDPYDVKNGYYFDANGEKQKAPGWNFSSVGNITTSFGLTLLQVSFPR